MRMEASTWPDCFVCEARSVLFGAARGLDLTMSLRRAQAQSGALMQRAADRHHCRGEQLRAGDRDWD
jgi:hypothetical protein